MSGKIYIIYMYMYTRGTGRVEFFLEGEVEGGNKLYRETRGKEWPSDEIVVKPTTRYTLYSDVPQQKN